MKNEGLERDVELRLRKNVERLGGLCLKWVSPGTIGVPDRVIIMPGGHVAFVELKRGDHSVTSMAQRLMLKRLSKLGANVRLLRGMEDVDAFIRELALTRGTQE